MYHFLVPDQYIFTQVHEFRIANHVLVSCGPLRYFLAVNRFLKLRCFQGQHFNTGNKHVLQPPRNLRSAEREYLLRYYVRVRPAFRDVVHKLRSLTFAETCSCAFISSELSVCRCWSPAPVRSLPHLYVAAEMHDICRLNCSTTFCNNVAHSSTFVWSRSVGTSGS